MKCILWLILLINMFHIAILKACQLPESLVGKRILLHVYGLAAETNPLADNIVMMHFNQRDYQVMILDTGKKSVGTYSYQRYEFDLAELRIKENVSSEGKTVMADYTNTFVCQSDTSGLYIFNGIEGTAYPQYWQHSGRYFIQSH
ncbi:hypothetical protein [uncultured Shewanella sp.]|uniref:hypothetical protein n=1 Tax=uncultured Shewanella sp. TaxID=173975 RepID=UPI00261E1FA6|nr:hypothetical protein [uncultured Shewanella sp.]